jgi:hypothetical protein
VYLVTLPIYYNLQRIERLLLCTPPSHRWAQPKRLHGLAQARRQRRIASASANSELENRHCRTSSSSSSMWNRAAGDIFRRTYLVCRCLPREHTVLRTVLAAESHQYGPTCQPGITRGNVHNILKGKLINYRKIPRKFINKLVSP